MENTTSTPFRIRIVGGSIGGLFAGVLLDKQGFDVRIYERSGADLSGRGAGLTGGRELFDAIRLLGCSHVGQLNVVSKGQVSLAKDGRVIERFAAPGSRFSWDLLYKTARSMLTEDKYLNDRHVSKVEDGDRSAKLLFSDGSDEVADLVIGADGISSVVRAAVNPLDHDNRYAGYAAWRILLPEQDLPDELKSWSEDLVGFTETGIQSIGYMVPGASGEVSLGKRRYSWGWYRQSSKEALDKILMDGERRFAYSLPPGRMPDRLVEQFQLDASKALPPQFAAVTQAGSKPWIQGIFDYVPNRIAGRRVVLIGDAAALARPHVGLGTSKAAGDAVALSRALESSLTFEDALVKYERERLPYGRSLVERSIEIGAALRLA